MYNGGRYVHLSADCPGFTGNIYRILISSTLLTGGRVAVGSPTTDGFREGEYPVDGVLGIHG